MKPNQRQKLQANNHLIDQGILLTHIVEQPNLVEFSMDDLAMIAGSNGAGKPEDEYEDNGITLNHNEIIVSSPNTTQPKSPTIVLLNLVDLAMIAGGNGTGKPENEYEDDALSANHNETIVSRKNVAQAHPLKAVLLSIEDLVEIAGGNGDGKPEDDISGSAIQFNHNETIVSHEKPVLTNRHKVVVPLSVQELATIIGGNHEGIPDDAPTVEQMFLNHNEILVTSETAQLS